MRRVTVFALVAIVASSCGGAGVVEVRGVADGGGRGAIDVRAIVQEEHRRQAPRLLRMAIAALGTLQPWLGPFPRASLTMLDPAMKGNESTNASVVVLERTPWWSSSRSMTPELATARALARVYWTEAIDSAGLPPWFVDGLVEFTARRIVAPVFQSENLPPGYAMAEDRFFGGMVPHFVWIRLLPEIDGDPLPAYRATQGAAAGASTTAPPDRRSLVAKTVLMLNTLERWVSRPVLDGALAQFVRAFRGDRPTLPDFTRTLSKAGGQDLSWFFDQALRDVAVFDYAVTNLACAAGPDGRYETKLTVSRVGDAAFTGTTARRVGPFESGRGMTVLVEFKDGERAVEHWDGRDVRKTYIYRSAAQAVSATIDPDRVLLLDVDWTNNSRTLAPRGGPAATRWAARWMVWLDNLLLTYVALA